MTSGQTEFAAVFLQRFAGVRQGKGARLVLADDAERCQGAKQTIQSIGIGGALICELHSGAWSKSEFVSELQARRGADYPTVHEAHRHLYERLAVVGKDFLHCARSKFRTRSACGSSG